MVKDRLKPSRLTIDLEAIANNWRTLNTLSGKAGAAVKANAYGLGAVKVAEKLYNAGCRDFFVANWQEAEQLKGIIPEHHISVLNGISLQDIGFALAHQFKPVLNTPHQINLWRDNRGGLCDVMLDSGINRLGIDEDQCEDALFKGLEIDILMSHLASADEDNVQNDNQLILFNAMSKDIVCHRKSLANSAGIILGSDYHYELTRPGLALYGGVARPELEAMIDSVIKIETKIIQVRHVKKDAFIGYNATYQCPEDMMVATAALGYADGYLRSFSNKGSVQFNGKRLPIIGRVSMDLITIDVRESPQLREGDMVEIDYKLSKSSIISGLSQYELLTGLSSRFELNYIG